MIGAIELGGSMCVLAVATNPAGQTHRARNDSKAHEFTSDSTSLRVPMIENCLFSRQFF